ncbi:MAG: CopG family antitoxin [Crocosphaera sp.]
MVIHKLSDPYKPSDEELEQIGAIYDDEIDFYDAPETDLVFWSKATKMSPKNKDKTKILVSLDQELMNWLKSESENQGVDYSSLITSILFSYKEKNS